MNNRNKLFLALAFALFSFYINLTISRANPMPSSWLCLDTTAPARSHFQCAYHSQRHTIILFGGQDNLGQMPNELWEYDYSHWTLLNFAGPSGRVDFGMCYDNFSNNIVLFGGKDSLGNYLGDTWILSDTGWVQLNISGPSPRAGFAMAINCNHEIILFGVADGQISFGETWKFNGTDWTFISDEGPSARIYADMACDPALSYLILFGGLDLNTGQALNDTWEWYGTTWYQVDMGYGPDARFGHMMGYNSWFYGITLFGGQDSIETQHYYDETWGYDWGGWWELNGIISLARSFGDLATDDSSGKVIMIGGTNGIQTFHDVWEYPVFYGPYMAGDVNGNWEVNGVDIVYFVNYLKGGPPPPRDVSDFCLIQPAPFFAAADVNGNCAVNGVDITYFVRYLKLQMPELLHCHDCIPTW
jgi:hypothetical protein